MTEEKHVCFDCGESDYELTYRRACGHDLCSACLSYHSCESSIKNEGEEEEEKMEQMSPKPSGQEKLTFGEAMQKVCDGQKVQRLEWPNKDVYLFMRDDRLMIHNDQGKNTPLILSRGDIEESDWIVINGYTHTTQ